MKYLAYILFLLLINFKVMAQHKTVITEETTFSTSTNFSSSLDKNQYENTLNYLKEKLGKYNNEKGNYKIWLVQNKKGEIFEIKCSKKEIKIQFNSKVMNSHAEREIENLIADISNIINKEK